MGIATLSFKTALLGAKRQDKHLEYKHENGILDPRIHLKDGQAQRPAGNPITQKVETWRVPGASLLATLTKEQAPDSRRRLGLDK